MISDLNWEDPPVRPSQPWMRQAIAELQAHPGKWARVIRPDGRDDHATSIGTRFRQLGAEVTMRGCQGNNRYHIWARWPDV